MTWLWTHRHLLMSLIRRQYQLRYRQSLVGFAWALVPPLVTLGAGVLVFHRVARVGGPTNAYVLATIAGLIPWTFFANSLTFGIPSVAQAQQMVSRVPFPRGTLPVSMIGTAVVDLAVAIVLFAGVAIIAGHGVPATAVWVPVLLAIELMLVVGVVLFGSALNVFARDVRLAVPLAVQLWLFLTPVMYPLGAVPSELRSWYLANPMTGVVESFRSVLIAGRSPDVELLLPALAAALVALVAGAWYFGSTEPRFADAI